MMGFEFSAVGNHELDKGLDELIRIQNGGCHPKMAALGTHPLKEHTSSF